MSGLNSGGGCVNCAEGSLILNPLAQFAEPVTATLADLRELARPTPAIATVQRHFVRLHRLTAWIVKITA
jgi:hypothetical protein